MNPIRNRFIIIRYSLSLLAGLFVAFAFSSAQAQQAVNCPDGAFAPTANIVCQIPESGIFNFTTINIPSGVTVRFKKNTRNTPVTILASGSVTIGGTIDVSGENGGQNSGGKGGPGGFDGGTGGLGVAGYATPKNGGGPGGGLGGYGGGGGGYAVAGKDGRIGNQGPDELSGKGGPRYGSSSLIPLIGGSGGGGGQAEFTTVDGAGGGSGGGGGGGILILCTDTITLNGGVITANGGSAGNGYGLVTEGNRRRGGGYGAGGGAGGAIRLVASAIRVNSATFGLGGGGGSPSNIGDRAGGDGAHGYIRIEATDLSNFSANYVIPNIPAAISIVTVPRPAVPSDAPKLTIKTVAGIATPAAPRGVLSDPPDINLLPTQTNPVPIVVTGENLPANTEVQVTVTPDIGERKTSRCNLAGTAAPLSCTVNMDIPDNAISVIQATATIDRTVAQLNPTFLDGERVKRMEISASFGGVSEMTYITESGRRIKRAE